MKTCTNKEELKSLRACTGGYQTFIKAHGNKDTLLSECLDSNGWDDVWWLISNTYDQFTDDQRHDLRLYGCKKALINIEKIQPYCTTEEEYNLIVNYLNSPTESAKSAAWSAAESAKSAAWSAESAAKSAAWSAESAAESAAWSAAWSAAESAAWSAAKSAAKSAAWSAAMKDFTEELRELFIKWENKQ